MEQQAEDTLARAFDSDKFNPYSEPLEAARYLIRELEREGFRIVSSLSNTEPKP